jgi:hypothetical protein
VKKILQKKKKIKKKFLCKKSFTKKKIKKKFLCEKILQKKIKKKILCEKILQKKNKKIFSVKFKKNNLFD